MANPPSILAFAGSLRAGSWNKKLLALGVSAARNAGGRVTAIDLRDFPLPIFDEDLETGSGTPENARKLTKLFLDHDALLFSCAEYNSSITGVWKNTIDWVSRPQPGQKPLAAFDGKVVALMSASTGVLGGLRGLVHVRAILGNIKCLVLPGQFALPHAHEAFDTQGQLKEPRHRAAVETLAAELVRVTAKLRA